MATTKSLRIDSKELTMGFKKYNSKMYLALKTKAQQEAQKMESFAKKNAPWTDRTTMARRTLKGSVVEEGKQMHICISHGMDYGVDLELDHGKKYAILPDTLIYGETEVLNSLKNLVTRL